MAYKIQPAGKVAILILLAGVIAAGYFLWQGAPSGTPTDNKAPVVAEKAGDEGKVIVDTPAAPVALQNKVWKIAVVEWPGHMGGIVGAGGKTTQPGSYAAAVKSKLVPTSVAGVNLEFVFIDDPIKRNASFLSGEVDFIWSTVDEMPINMPGYKANNFDPKVFLQVDWSRGGDACVAVNGINSVEDLLGRSIGVMKFGPDHTLLEYALNNSRLSKEQIQAVRSKTSFSPDDTTFGRVLFLQEKVDVACVWEPDVQLALKRPGSRVLISTKDATHLIADVLIGNQKVLDAHPDVAEKIVRVFIHGADLIAKDPKAAAALVHAVVPKFNSQMTVAETEGSFGYVKPAALGENATFFGLQGSDPDFDRVYSQADAIWVEYPDAAIENRYLPTKIRNDKFVKVLYEEEKALREEEARVKAIVPEKIQEEKPAFNPQVAVSAAPTLTKPVTLNFGTGMSALDTESVHLLRTQVLPQVKLARGMYLRIEGNTDDTGNLNANVLLSKKRAEAVREYLIEQGLDPQQIVATGNGPNNPIASNKTPEGRAANRRTDILFVSAN